MIATPHVVGFAHESVLTAEVLEYLAPRDHCRYVDGTLGGAGHAAAILERAPAASLIGIDRDPAALLASATRLHRFGDRARLVRGEYADLPAILAGEQVDGIVLDLGVSSPQLDDPERGFSFTKPGPLDMRMDPTRGRTARELIDDLTADELAEVIRDLGEERHAKKVARLIKEADRLETTLDLAGVIAKAIPLVEQRKSKIHPATRTFQALRIAVNAELEQLERFLAAFPALLAPGGRCVIISFHSLEDRLVKNRFRDLAWSTSLPPKLAVQARERVEPVVTLVTKKPVFAGDDEVAKNPRARSARLRACERTTAPDLPSGNPHPTRD